MLGDVPDRSEGVLLLMGDAVWTGIGGMVAVGESKALHYDASIVMRRCGVLRIEEKSIYQVCPGEEEGKTAD